MTKPVSGLFWGKITAFSFFGCAVDENLNVNKMRSNPDLLIFLTVLHVFSQLFVLKI